MCVLPEDLAFAPTILHAAQKSGLQVVKQLQFLVQPATRVSARDPLHPLPEILFFAFEPSMDVLRHPAGRFRNELAARKHAFGDDFRRGAGRSRPQVGDKIADGEIDFVANGGNHGNRRFKNGAGNDLFVKGPEVFETAAAAGEENQVDGR